MARAKRLLWIAAVTAILAACAQTRINRNGGGLVVLYRLEVNHRVWVEEDVAEGDSTWRELEAADKPAPWVAGADPCETAGNRLAEAALVFIPIGGGRLQVEWHGKKGDAGPYYHGAIVQNDEGWNYVGDDGNTCAVDAVEWDRMRRLLKIALRCEWRMADGSCRGEDRVVIRFPEPEEIHSPDVQELPWNAEVEGRSIRYGDELDIFSF